MTGNMSWCKKCTILIIISCCCFRIGWTDFKRHTRGIGNEHYSVEEGRKIIRVLNEYRLFTGIDFYLVADPNQRGE